MNLNYDKIKRNYEAGGNQWTSYSDLFMMLSLVFLLLFIVANTRTGSNAISSTRQLKVAEQEVEDLKRQLKVYEVLRDDYQNKGASDEEVQIYKEVISKLNLLEGDARSEREALFKQAKEAQEKEQSLNRYQQMVKNIINANMLAQSKLKRKENIIEERVQEISEAEAEVTDLAKNVRRKEATIAKNKATISGIEFELERKIKALEYAYKTHKTSRAKMKAEIAKLQKESHEKITDLESTNQKVGRELKIAQAEVEKQTRETQRLSTTLTQKEAEYQSTVQTLKEAKDQALARAKQNFDNTLAQAKLSAAAKLDEEKKYRAQVEALNQTYDQKVRGLQSELAQTQSNVKAISSELESKSAETKRLMGELADREAQAQRQISSLQRAHEAAMGREQAAYQAKLAQAKLSGQQKLAEERKHRASLEAMNAQYNQKLQGLNQELGSARGNLKDLEAKYAGALGDLTKLMNEKKQWANQIKSELAKHGVSAQVDAKSGDVTINFGQEYFDTGNSNLKPGMRSTLQRFFPIYAKSLMNNRKLANRLSSVEIVGFASPTYRGKFVNPESLAAEDRAAVNYNMDLSYQRAKSIFEHVFDPTKMTYEHQKQLLPYVKVTGRSYLATDKTLGRNLSAVGADDYCKRFDCKQAQKVIIRFNLKEN